MEHAFSGGEPAAQVSEEAMARAIRYMRKVRRHAHTLYSSILSSSPAYELARAVARSIVAAEEPMAAVTRDWMTQHCQAFKKADGASAVRAQSIDAANERALAALKIEPTV